MRRFLSIILLLLLASQIDAQKLIGVSTYDIQAINIWEKNTDGFYSLQQNVPVSRLSVAIDAKDVYSYDKKTLRLYVKLSNANCVLTLTPSSNKIVKKQLKAYKVPCLKADELITKEQNVNNELSQYYSQQNELIDAAKKEAERRAREEAMRKAREDSIRLDTYRRNHNWRIMNVKSTLYCEECEESHTNDSIYVLSISNDSISYFHFKPDDTMLYSTLRLDHYSKISSALANDMKFKEYNTIWADSIADHEYTSGVVPFLINRMAYEKYIDEIRKDAPYGFIKDWGWELNSVAGIESRFEYTNTNKKTIKYIDFYFSVYNAVGDICSISGSGNVAHVRGIGPVETFETGSWDWDHASHYTKYSASEMRIVKLVITYMDGTVKTIPKGQIVYE